MKIKLKTVTVEAFAAWNFVSLKITFHCHWVNHLNQKASSWQICRFFSAGKSFSSKQVKGSL